MFFVSTRHFLAKVYTTVIIDLTNVVLTKITLNKGLQNILNQLKYLYNEWIIVLMNY